jgi:hypothetical protein
MHKKTRQCIDIWDSRPYIRCIPNKGKLTLNSCQINQTEAAKGLAQLLSGRCISSIPDHQIERLMACGGCEHCQIEVSIVEVKRRLVEEFDKATRELYKREYRKMRR